MKIEIKVPAMGESVNEATIGAILKATGTSLKLDDEILELETDKVNQALYALQAGRLTLTVQTGETVKIGQIVGYIDSEELEKKENAPVSSPIEKAELAEMKPIEKEGLKVSPPINTISTSSNKREELPKSAGSQAGSSHRLSIQEYVAHLKDQTNLTPAPISDQLLTLSNQAVNKLPETRRPMTRLRKVIGERLVESLHTTAMLTTFNEVDMSQIMALRDKYKESFLKKQGVKLGLMSFFVKATVSALQAFPNFNSYIEGTEIVQRNYYHIGIAVSTEKGLFVPVIRQCDQLSFAEIEKSIEDYATRARAGQIKVDDLQGGGFTITNAGVYGSLLSTPILVAPQCGILGMHKIMKRPLVVEDQLVIKPMMYLALSYDHRLIDGKEAVSFLIHIKNHLEDPTLELLDL